MEKPKARWALVEVTGCCKAADEDTVELLPLASFTVGFGARGRDGNSESGTIAGS